MKLRVRSSVKEKKPGKGILKSWVNTGAIPRRLTDISRFKICCFFFIIVDLLCIMCSYYAVACFGIKTVLRTFGGSFSFSLKFIYLTKLWRCLNIWQILLPNYYNLLSVKLIGNLSNVVLSLTWRMRFVFLDAK